MSALNRLRGKTISLAATIQYLDLIPKVKEYLESKNKRVILKKGAYYEGHVLGCNSSAFDKNADTRLLITDGKFHAINNAMQTQKEIYVFNGRNLEKVEQKEIEEYNRKLESKRKRFLAAKTIGLLVSSKPGQMNKNTIRIKEKVMALDKEVYVFESNDINPSDFENYPKISIWVNTACFGLSRDTNYNNHNRDYPPKHPLANTSKRINS